LLVSAKPPYIVILFEITGAKNMAVLGKYLRVYYLNLNYVVRNERKAVIYRTVMNPDGFASKGSLPSCLFKLLVGNLQHSKKIILRFIHSYIHFHARFPLRRVANAAAPRGLEIPLGQQSPQVTLLAPQQDRAKHCRFAIENNESRIRHEICHTLWFILYQL